MINKVFWFLFLVGFIIICVLAFTIPTDPFEMIPSVSALSFDKPLWFAIILVGTFFYTLILSYIFDKIKKVLHKIK